MPAGLFDDPACQRFPGGRLSFEVASGVGELGFGTPLFEGQARKLGLDSGQLRRLGLSRVYALVNERLQPAGLGAGLVDSPGANVAYGDP